MEKQVFYCRPCGLAVVLEHGPVVCKKCSKPMHNAGWVEYAKNAE